MSKSLHSDYFFRTISLLTLNISKPSLSLNKWNAIYSVWTTFWKLVLIFSILLYHIHVSSLNTSLLSYISIEILQNNRRLTRNLRVTSASCLKLYMIFFSILLFKYFFKTVKVRVNNVVAGFVSNQPLKISLVRNASKHVCFLNVEKYADCSDSRKIFKN